MSLPILLSLITLIAVLFTIAMVSLLKVSKNTLTTFLQNFTGVFFIISGAVKLVDPLGTSYKMEDYFVELEAAFEGSWMSFIAPIFPWLEHYTVSFGMIMIILEIALGIWLIIGYLPKLTSWLFFLIVLFFTFLTGFTYLTGYVADGVNFFSFSEWGEYAKSNMKVTDCGCFGDFIKLEPKTTFIKDLFLLLPAIYFLLMNKTFHKLGSKFVGHIISFVSIAVMLVYGLSNFVWDIPDVDFRPFKVGTDIPAVRKAEEKALQSIKILGYVMKNEKTGEEERILGSYEKARLNHTKSDGWIVKDQIRTKPTLKTTKISEFDFADKDGNDVTPLILEDPNTIFLIIAYELGVESQEDAVRFVMDTTVHVVVDTVSIKPLKINVDTIEVYDKVEENYTKYNFNEAYLNKYRNKLIKFIEKSAQNGNKVYMFVGKAGQEEMNQFATALGLGIPLYEKDEILLKTIVRSNPGIVEMKKGVIINKWHINKLPEFDEVKK